MDNFHRKNHFNRQKFFYYTLQRITSSRLLLLNIFAIENVCYDAETTKRPFQRQTNFIVLNPGCLSVRGQTMRKDKLDKVKRFTKHWQENNWNDGCDGQRQGLRHPVCSHDDQDVSTLHGLKQNLPLLLRYHKPCSRCDVR